VTGNQLSSKIQEKYAWWYDDELVNYMRFMKVSFYAHGVELEKENRNLGMSNLLVNWWRGRQFSAALKQGNTHACRATVTKPEQDCHGWRNYTEISYSLLSLPTSIWGRQQL